VEPTAFRDERDTDYFSMAFAVDVEMLNMRMRRHLKRSARHGEGVPLQ